jgi:hypothetical protein
MKALQQILYILSLLAFLVVCFFSFMIYTSLMDDRLPWHEPCGMQFVLVLFVSCPAMFAIGAAYWAMGRHMQILKATVILPFATSGALGLLLFIDESLGTGMQIAGTIFCILAAVASVGLAIVDLFKNLISKTADRIPIATCDPAKPSERMKQ